MTYFTDDKKESLELIFSYILDFLKLIPFRLIFDLIIFAIALYIIVTLMKCLFTNKKDKKINKIRFEKNKKNTYNKESENSKKVINKIKERNKNFNKELFVKQAIKIFKEQKNENVIIHHVEFLSYSYNDVKEIITIVLNASVSYYEEKEDIEKVIEEGKYNVLNNTYKMSFIREKDNDWTLDKVLLP